MSKLSVDQKIIKDLLSSKTANFLIPDYQRPYAWTLDECGTLWDDLFDFAFPEKDSGRFNTLNEYYLGPIVTFRNPNGQLEIIDGQQRLTTIMLLLRAFYDKFTLMKDESSIKIRTLIATCVWTTDEFGDANLNELKIDSEVASDNDKNEFLTILKTGSVEKNWKSTYANNFRFFKERISELTEHYPSYVALFAARILNNAILLPIEAESQDTALRIFSTLNDRGLPLSDADIFKSQFYKYFTSIGEKDHFINEWKKLEQLCESIFIGQKRNANSMDELFTRYMYYERAKKGIRDTTTKSLRDFYSENSYELLKNKETFTNLYHLANFWKKVVNLDSSFNEDVRKCLYVLSAAPNGMWMYLLSVYFFAKRDGNNELNQADLKIFLNKITAFIFAYAIDRPGVNALRSPVYPEMINLIKGKEVEFADYHFQRSALKTQLEMYDFTNQRPITRSMLFWWMLNNSNQKPLDMSIPMEIEHIYSRRRARDYPLKESSNLESIGNKTMLEKRINIRASDYRFEDKKKYYTGYTDNNGDKKEPTANLELLALSDQQADFTEDNIVDRKAKIINEFITYLDRNGLIKN